MTENKRESGRKREIEKIRERGRKERGMKRRNQ